MMDTERLASRIAIRRAQHLEKALDDAKRWCAAPNMLVGNKPSDQHWLELFGSETQRSVDASDAHAFLTTFMLTNRVSWDKAAVAGVFNEYRETPAGPVEEDVQRLSFRLMDCIRSRNKSLQTSAASKFALFAKPHARVFIWDQLASRSARLRDWTRASEKPRSAFLNKLYRRSTERQGRKVEMPDYAAYAAACAAALEEELAREDFRQAADDFTAYLSAMGGPMSNPVVADRDFTQRRLLDKLMFWEGHAIRSWSGNRETAEDLPERQLVELML